MKDRLDTAPLSPDLTHAVLAYLGVPPASPTLDLLDALVVAYTCTVPWESAFRIAKRARTPDTADCPRWPDEFWTDALARGDSVFGIIRWARSCTSRFV